MKKTKTQREYHQAIKEANNSANISNSPKKSLKERLLYNSFTRSRFFYYGIRIILVIVIMTLVGQLDEFILGYFYQ